VATKKGHIRPERLDRFVGTIEGLTIKLLGKDEPKEKPIQKR
jgi:hypothetical protein